MFYLPWLVACGIVASAFGQENPSKNRHSVVIADFESGTFGGWRWEGTCAGSGPETGRFAGQVLSGWQGRYFLSTAHPRNPGQTAHSGVGRGTSPAFEITGDTLQCLVAGGNHDGQCCLNLIVDGKIVLSTTGGSPYQFRRVYWDVREWQGKTAFLEIVDTVATGPHGYIHVDEIILTGIPRPPVPEPVTVPPIPEPEVAVPVQVTKTVVMPAPPRRKPAQRRNPVLSLRPPIAPYTTDLLPTEKIVVPMVFPLLGGIAWHDNYNNNRGTHRHTGIDIAAPKMHPIVAPFSGKVGFKTNTFWIYGDIGYKCLGTHLNDDTPGTNDNTAQPDFMFAPNLRIGDPVIAGQLIGYVGNSGDATGPHLHFELFAPEGIRNPAPSLRNAQRVGTPRLDTGGRTLWPASGEVRVLGCLRAFDPARRVASVLWVARQLPGGKTVVATRPQRYRLTFPPAVLAKIGATTLASIRNDRMISFYVREQKGGLAGEVVRAVLPESEKDSAE